MHPHHEESIQKLFEYFRPDPDVIAVILGGSVAKNLERPDSDLDAMVIVTEEKLAQVTEEGRAAECIRGYCTYPEGYFDVKYYHKAFLAAAAERGSEPARNAFLGAYCLYSDDSEIPEILKRIPVFQKQEKADKMLSFYAAFMLNSGFFWNSSRDNRFLRMQSAVNVVFYGLRLLLEDREVLFPCHKALTATVGRLSDKPEGILEMADMLIAFPTDGNKECFHDTILENISYRPPENYMEALSRYVADNEQWWLNPRPPIAEW